MTTILTRLKYAYFSLPFPWRRRLLMGTDLHNNTYWELRVPGGTRPRRTVEFADKTRDWADYAGDVPVQWHQWLRTTRDVPPSVQELVQDAQRVERVKVLAAQADQRWISAGGGEGMKKIGPGLEVGVMGPGREGKGVGKGLGALSAHEDGPEAARTQGLLSVKGTGMSGVRSQTEVNVAQKDPWKAAEEERKRAEAGQASTWSPSAAPRPRQ